jgi:hypothetical protein|tara:strand:+ start:324 stop:725 length:402 start_codon:yes stop_codon:yes gene_type:complete
MASIEATGGAGAVDLGEVFTEISTKSNNLIKFPVPLSDSENTILMDLFGTERTIVLDGVKVGVLAVLRTFVEEVEAIIKLQTEEGSQVLFTSSWTGVTNMKCLIQDFSYTKIKGDESQVKYSLTLQEGQAIGS